VCESLEGEVLFLFDSFVVAVVIAKGTAVEFDVESLLTDAIELEEDEEVEYAGV
jgi:hypothetical protein